MKIDRLIGIIAVLLNRGKVTMPYLAERFEVSRRTIARDIEDICRAGIPLVTEQGYGGGVSIAPGYTIERSVLTAEEVSAVLAGISGLDSVSETPKGPALADKLLVKEQPGRGGMAINLASYYKTSLSSKISQLKTAASKRFAVEFDYYSPEGETRREVEPYLVLFQWSSWYLVGYCLLRQDFRMFKLNRMWNLAATKREFSPRQVPEKYWNIEKTFEDRYLLRALFDRSLKYRLIDEYGPECWREEADGRLGLEVWFENFGHMLEWVSGFGSLVEVLEPEELRLKVAEEAQKVLRLYKKEQTADRAVFSPPPGDRAPGPESHRRNSLPPQCKTPIDGE